MTVRSTSLAKVRFAAACCLAALIFAGLPVDAAHAYWRFSTAIPMTIGTAEPSTSLSIAVGKSKATWTHAGKPPSIASIEARTGRISLDFGDVGPKNQNNSPDILRVTNGGTAPTTHLHIVLSDDIRFLFSSAALNPDVVAPGKTARLGMKLSGAAVAGGSYSGTLSIVDDAGGTLKTMLVCVRVKDPARADFATDTFAVTLDGNGGIPATSTVTVAYGTALCTSMPATPTRVGYLFAGWYSDLGLTTGYDLASPVRGDMTLYAKWTDVGDMVSFAVGKSKAMGVHRGKPPSIASIDATTGQITFDFGEVSPKNRRRSPEILLVTNISDCNRTLHAELSENLRPLFSEVSLDPAILRPGAVATLAAKLSGRAIEGSRYDGTLTIRDENGQVVSTIIVRLWVEGVVNLDRPQDDPQVPSCGDEANAPAGRSTGDAPAGVQPSIPLTITPAPEQTGETRETTSLLPAEPPADVEDMRTSSEASSCLDATLTPLSCDDATRTVAGSCP